MQIVSESHHRSKINVQHDFIISKIEFITATRGARQLVKGDYRYNKNKSGNNGNAYWECVERRSGNGCKVKIVLGEYDDFLNPTGEHMHPPNPEYTKAQRIRSHMKRGSRKLDATTNNRIAANVAGANYDVLANIGKIDSVRRDVRRQRAAIMEYPPIPDDTVFGIPAPFNVSSTGEQFIHYDNGREDRSIIFGTRKRDLSFPTK